MQNKNILISGSNKGIGKEISLGMSLKGANVILLGRDSEGLNNTYDLINEKYNTRPLIIECDLETLNQTQATEINNEIISHIVCKFPQPFGDYLQQLTWLKCNYDGYDLYNKNSIECTGQVAFNYGKIFLITPYNEKLDSFYRYVLLIE